MSKFKKEKLLPKLEGHTAIPLGLSQDERLSFGVRGLYAVMLRQGEVNAEGDKIGRYDKNRKATRSKIKQLIEFGYAHKKAGVAGIVTLYYEPKNNPHFSAR